MTLRKIHTRDPQLNAVQDAVDHKFRSLKPKDIDGLDEAIKQAAPVQPGDAPTDHNHTLSGDVTGAHGENKVEAIDGVPVSSTALGSDSSPFGKAWTKEVGIPSTDNDNESVIRSIAGAGRHGVELLGTDGDGGFIQILGNNDQLGGGILFGNDDVAAGLLQSAFASVSFPAATLGSQSLPWPRTYTARVSGIATASIQNDDDGVNREYAHDLVMPTTADVAAYQLSQQPGFLGYWDMRQGVQLVDGGVAAIESAITRAMAFSLAAAHRPIYIPSDSDFGGRPSMLFEGDEWLDLSGIAAALSSSTSAMPEVTWYFLMKLDSEDAFQTIMLCNLNNGTHRVTLRTSTNNRLFMITNGDGDSSTTTETPDDSFDLNPAVWTARYSSTRTARKGGTEIVSEADPGTGPLTVERVTIGARRPDSDPLSFERGIEAKIAAFACFAAEHDTSTMSVVEGLL